MSTKPKEPAAEILGYKLEQRIGSGGFGEVWSVEGPGGLKKALKIVYGFHDEKRAQAELKALDRVKSLRHPFLLSLERIEVFEGQLIVVTELADASLADHFNSYVSRGEPGIPRDEMLRFMANAAEALDFLSNEKSLQHLDVKPENLLLVGSHVKVADFGLMKDLKAASQSLMQGMTPAYAAPELFDGAPAPSSDQYSLAIMYCEMISGVRPFPGTTPAQLAAQHVHGKPNLRPIPRGDHAAVARALSKDPNVRYPSCMAFVDDLRKQRRTVRIARRRTESRNGGGSETLIYSNEDSSRLDMTEMVSDGALPFQSDSMVAIEPPNCDGSSSKIHPTLVITIGQTANRVGQKFKAKLLMRTGDNEAAPSIRSLFIDSDRKDLARLEAASNDSVSSLETIETPLRKPEDYRARAEVHLGWLSRRWIYNVPRTLQTEGLRPLGRLVFADYFSTICDRLEEVIDEFTKAENLARTADKLSMNPGDVESPRVYIVSSISGGVGSGMMLDLAYTVKLLLAEKGIKHDHVTGVLLHSTYQRTRDPGLSSANAFAFLTEMRHFNEQGYPGDSNLGIPEFDEEGPFQHTYYTELGDDLNQSDFDAKLDEVAEYISLAATTRCSEFFEACRASELEMNHFALRTMGVATTMAGDEKQREALVGKLCQKLIQRWSGVGNDEEDDPAMLAEAILSQLDVEESGIRKRVQAEVVRFRIEDQQQILQAARESAHDSAELNRMLDGVYGDWSEDTVGISGANTTELRKAMDQFLTIDPVAGEFMVTKACYRMLNLDNLCLGAVEATAANLGHRFRGWLTNIARDLDETRNRINSLVEVIAHCQSPDAEMDQSEDFLERHLVQLCAERETEFVKRISREFVQIILNDLQPIDTVVAQVKMNLQMVASEYFDTSDAFDLEHGTNTFDPQRLLLDQVEAKLDVMAEKVERSIFHSLISPEGGFQHVLTDYSILRYNLPNQMRAAAQQVICSVNERLSVEEMIREHDIAPEQLFQWMTGLINEAKPLVNDCGGQMRLLLGMPTQSGETRLPQLIEVNCRLKNTVVNGTDGKVAICFEADDVSLAAVAFRLLVKRPDAVELVKRIHTRDDIDWTSLDDLL
ncbi:protein kinase domain-containing protein [Mariniblastus fucicola]|uniref:Serine/threonine-protein kinase PknF n=1 Tax=Mariniblastus fucicola TaxID=980251 RepID=A0A5B9PEB7_9BACT|nr:tubulin-like doman-containing protein [Mariniblastus fucicola]QEG24574.1 Serine/threonine-protein kinase PknF [Mariniblastus fucicola]